jgi:hypothetical protein
VTDQTDFMARHGPTLVERGYRILPIRPGAKSPGAYSRNAWHGYAEWSRHCERDTTEHEVATWSDWPQAGVGIATGNVIGIDIDVVQAPDIADAIQALAMQQLGHTPAVRIGRAPKRLLVYRAAEPFRGFKRHPIEVLGVGQQFVAYAIHPDTGQPYDWPVSTLSALDLIDLPTVTKEQVEAFVAQAITLVPSELRPNGLPRPASAPGVTPGPSELRGTFDAVASALQYIVNADLDYDSWVRIGMAIKGALGEEGRQLFEAWSATSSKNRPKATSTAWQGFNPERIGAGTVYRLAIESGWCPPAELQLNGEIPVGDEHPAKALLKSLSSPPAETATATPPPPPPTAPPRMKMPPGWDNVGGVIADMMKLMVTTAKRPQPVLALAASLCAVGALMGRKYRADTNVRSNLYMVGIAESGAGKNHARVVINELFGRAGLTQYIGGNKIASGSGLLTAIVRQPSILFQLDEFGMFLTAAADRRSSPRHVTEILDLMTELFTTAGTTYFGIEYASGKHNDAHRLIHQPCLCVYGTTTPLHFWQALQAANVADGSLARFLIVESEDDFPESNERFGVVDPPQDLIDRLIAIHEGGGKLNGNFNDCGAITQVMVDPRVVPMTPQARVVFLALDRSIMVRLRGARGTANASILARIEEHATKLALIRAVSRDAVNPQIEDHDAEWGLLIATHCAEYSMREAQARVSENLVEQHHKRALKLLRDAGPAGMLRSDFTRRTQFMDSRQREGVLQTLIDAGFLEVEIIASGRRPGQLLRAVTG